MRPRKQKRQERRLIFPTRADFAPPCPSEPIVDFLLEARFQLESKLDSMKREPEKAVWTEHWARPHQSHGRSGFRPLFEKWRAAASILDVSIDSDNCASLEVKLEVTFTLNISSRTPFRVALAASSSPLLNTTVTK
jgi:hypothetical protein